MVDVIGIGGVIAFLVGLFAVMMLHTWLFPARSR